MFIQGGNNMSTFEYRSFKCSICGEESMQQVMRSTNAFGSYDLDLRPPEMERSTMPWWIQQCPRCGYVSENISKPAQVDAQFVSSDEYRNAGNMQFSSDLAADFYRRYLIAVKCDDRISALTAVHRATWASDDAGDEKNSIRCRKTAAALLEKLIKDGEFEGKGLENMRCLHMDLLRRSGQFFRLKRMYRRVKFSQDILNTIARFQLERASVRDRACYTVEQAQESCE